MKLTLNERKMIRQFANRLVEAREMDTAEIAKRLVQIKAKMQKNVQDLWTKDLENSVECVILEGPKYNNWYEDLTSLIDSIK